MTRAKGASRSAVALFALLLAGAAPAAADQDQAPKSAPPSSKLTIAYYDFSSGKAGMDTNFRYSFRSTTEWIGVYHEDSGFDQTRVGFEYDYRSSWLTLVPSVQAATHDFAGATVYAEVGGRVVAIGGAGRTNLNPYWNLGFDPNDYVQAGAGYRGASGNAFTVFAIHDNRLGTGQTNTHVIARRFLSEWRLTIDAVNEHGRGDDDVEVNGWAFSVDVERPRWFVRVARDPHVNYTPDRQVRIVGGLRF